MKKNKIDTVTPYSSRKFYFGELAFIPPSLCPSSAIFNVSNFSEVIYCSFDWISLMVDQVKLEKCKDITSQKMKYVSNGKISQYKIGKHKFKVIREKTNDKRKYKIEINPRSFDSFDQLLLFLNKISDNPESAKLLRLDICVFLRADLFSVEWLRGCIGYEKRSYKEEYPCAKPHVVRHGGGYMESIIYGNGQTRLSLYSKRTKALYEIKDVKPVPNTIAMEIELKSGWLKKNGVSTIAQLNRLNLSTVMSEISFNNVWGLPGALPAKDLNLFYSFFMNCMAFGYQQARSNFYCWNRNSYEKLDKNIESLKIGKDQRPVKEVLLTVMKSDLKGWLNGRARIVPFDLEREPLPVMLPLF